MLYLVIAFFLLLGGLYCILAQAFHAAPFRMSGLADSFKTKKQGNAITHFLDAAAAKLAPVVPMFNVSRIKLAQTLDQAGISRSPQEYVARLALVFCALALAGLLLFFLNHALGIMVWIAAGLLTFILQRDASETAKERTAKLETQLPYFIGLFGASIRHNPNIIDILDSYRRNYDNELSHELALTIADMRTGDPAVALQRFDARMHLPLLSDLIRGILATMNGDDMTAHFANLVEKSNNQWRQSLTQKALRVKSKFSSMSLILAMYAIISMVAVAVLMVMEGGFQF